ncbi:MAG TPA: DUF192 domain-containing protein [Iamia sp.]|jgi:uncharacterized membrane protein (UPF0127 family)|nr:DUF192 domain-containing protein [Iamia sp.]
MTSRRRRAATWALLVAVLLAACGGDDDAGAPTTTSTSLATAGGSDATEGSSTTDGTTGNGLPPVTGLFAEGRTPIPGFGEIEVRIVEGPDGEPIVICVLVAETPAQRQRGLMEVTDLGGYDGMLFRFPADSDGGFWMKDTVLPLSIAYLDADGAVVSTADMDPCPPGTDRCPSYPADDPYRMALEVEQGGLAPLALEEGGSARLEVTGPCPPLTTSD